MQFNVYMKGHFKMNTTIYMNGLISNIKKDGAEIIMDNEKEKIASFLKDNNIEYLVHFTPVKNLKSILEHGICSNKYCNEHGIKYVPTD